MKFEALIDGVHFDAKKGSVKIVLVGASHVSLDELTTLSPKDGGSRSIERGRCRWCLKLKAEEKEGG
jgi:hypothetical protein